MLKKISKILVIVVLVVVALIATVRIPMYKEIRYEYQSFYSHMYDEPYYQAKYDYYNVYGNRIKTTQSANYYTEEEVDALMEVED